MTIRQVIERGFTVRKEDGDLAKLAWLNQESARRFVQLHWVLEARRMNIRTAHRRWCRRNGMSFKGNRRIA